MRRPTQAADRAVAWLVVATAAAFVLWQLYPSLLLADTTPAKGDLGAHLHEPSYLRHHLLPHWRLSGWSHDWFTGYPALTFYFPFGSLLVVLVDLFLPYNVAFKLVAATGPVALPVAAYAFGRLSGRDRSTSACLAVAVLPVLLEPSLLTAGGSLAAAAVGEYGYGLSLALGLVVLGLARAGLRTGRGRVPTAALLAVTVLLHLLPAVVVVLGILVATALRASWAAVRWSASVLGVAAALTAFWWVPFLLRATFTAGPDYAKSVPLGDWLLPATMAPVAVLALAGIVVAFAHDDERRDGLGPFLVAMAVVSGLLFAVTPTGRVWNARFLAGWFLWLGLLAGFGVAGVARLVDEARRQSARGRSLDNPALARLVVPVVLLVVALPVWESRLSGGLVHGGGFEMATITKPFVEGYERSSFRDEYQGFVDTMRRVGREDGCGRAHVEWDASAWADVRAAFVQLLPHWNDGCISSTEGLYIQSSPTSPFVRIANSRLSSEPYVLPDSGEDREFDVAAGVADLRVLGVRYFVASAAKTIEAADASPELRPITETEPYEDRFWKVYEVRDSTLVEPLEHVPVVVPGMGASRASWERRAKQWYDGGTRRDVVLVADGPPSWPRSRDGDLAKLPRRNAPEATVGRVRLDDDRISFRVSRVGVPVLVKVSYFPNWQASGADGPWRVAPNHMVVIPTSKNVTLRYGRTLVDHIGVLGTLAGVAGLVVVGRRGPIGMPAPAEPSSAAARPSKRPPAPPKRKKRR